MWWFFSVVIIGIVVGLIPAYLKPRIDNFLAKFSKSRREALEQKAKAITERVNLLLTDTSELIHQEMEFTRLNISVAMWSLAILLGLMMNVQGVLLAATNPELLFSCVEHINLATCYQTSQGDMVLLLFWGGTGAYLIASSLLGFAMGRRKSKDELLSEYTKRKKAIQAEKRVVSDVPGKRKAKR